MSFQLFLHGMATILPVTREATPVKMFENMILESKQDKRSIQNKKRIKDPFKTRTYKRSIQNKKRIKDPFKTRNV